LTMLENDKVPFQQVLDALLDESKPFPPVYLHRFSDLESRHLNELRARWNQVPVSRRRALLEDLEELADVDTLMNFDDLARFSLKDLDPQVRALSIRLLWEAEDKKLVPVFIQMMAEDMDHQVRAAAANALGLFVFLGELEEIPEDLLQEIVDNLIMATTGEDHPLVRRRALESLGYSGREDVVPLLQEAYERGNPEWLASALYAMGRSADQRWSGNIMRMIDHPNSTVREEAVRAAGELELTAARDPLIQIVEEDDDDIVKMAAVWSLSQIGGGIVRPFLERLAEETEDEEEVDLIEEALDNLSFTEDMNAFDLIDIDFDEDDSSANGSDSGSKSKKENKETRKSKKNKKD